MSRASPLEPGRKGPHCADDSAANPEARARSLPGPAQSAEFISGSTGYGEKAALMSQSARRSGADGGREIDEPVAHHIKSQLGVVAELHLFEQALAVYTHRLHRERERVRD